MDKLINRKFNLAKEIDNCERLLYQADIKGFSLYSLIEYHFTKWEHRMTFISFDDMRMEMGFKIILRKDNVNIEEFCIYSECMINILYFIYFKVLNLLSPDKACFIETIITTILENINKVLAQIGYEIKKSNSYNIIVPKDSIANEAAEIVQDNYNLGEDIFLYRHRDLKGDLIKKADILSRLYKYFEGNLFDALNGNNQSSLAESITCLTNNLNVRHSPKGKAKIVLEGFTENELEESYDLLFKLYLNAIVIVDYYKNKQDIDALKNKFKRVDIYEIQI